MSEPEIQRKRGLGAIYDTSYSPPPGGQPAIARHLDELHARYSQTLSEPVAVTQWSREQSTWNVFYATNRAPQGESPDLRFGNDVAAAVQYGRAAAVLPGRERGQDPIPLPEETGKISLMSFVPKFHKKEPRAYATLDRVHSLEPIEFHAGLKDQIERSTGKDLLLFVHGFNVDYEAAVIRTAQIACDLPFNGAICCYAWPSQGGIRNYGKDEAFNSASVEHFQTFLQNLIGNVPEDTKINIVVHSMGNRVVMQALNRMPEPHGDARPVSHVVLCAPDVGISDYYGWIDGVKKQSRRVTLYVGDGDTALAASKALHAEQRVGDALPPVLTEGVETIDCSPVELSLMGHSYYGGSIEVLCDLFCILKEDLPASERNWLTPIREDGETFWRFTSQPTPVHWGWNFPPEITGAGVVQQLTLQPDETLSR
ncbi:alpha/beta hydrolase [Rubinisphaera margarita]|uniref:alpha/beta hydrolase n=1 Tax=Rubinisphaera margarita TaxID=2909586 RepID=UPI001EE88F20|nr:alpha/beta hydrolase [Rubinisphaera margarita]MCG6154459.1 alpha/beta hydrolase [Rubinisphaera margarita]